jgi:AcrR family transcriptional regulator
VRAARRIRHQLSDRAGLLAAAGAVLAERGYHGASIRDIAGQAGFSVGGVYQFFPSKDELYLAVLDEGWRQFQTDLRSALRAKGALAQLEAVTRVMVANCESRRGLWQILTADHVGFPPAVERRVLERLRSHMWHMRSLITGIIRRGIRERLFRGTDVELLTSAYGGIIRQSISDALVLGTPVPTAAAVLGVFLSGARRPGSRR